MEKELTEEKQAQLDKEEEERQKQEDNLTLAAVLMAGFVSTL